MTSGRAGILVLLLTAGCPRALPGLLTDGGAGGGGGRSGCGADAQCPAGMVCEGCGSGEFSCVPGCRSDTQCKTNHLCRGPVACATCPCPPGWCEPDPCLDLDEDGYVQSCDPSVVCGTKQRCDCDDRNPNVHPGRAEVCSNGIDDNCDGRYEWSDPACGYCPGGQSKCSSTLACGATGSLFCSSGCCTPCPVRVPPQCLAGKCLVSGGVNPSTGCSEAPLCVDCGACPLTAAQVCGVNAATYLNACLAQAANITVLHEGPCLLGENLSCDSFPVGSTEGCGSKGELYCRDACPQCGGLGHNRCTPLGVCGWDGDCPAGKAALRCADGGVAPERCVDHACVADCP